MICRACHKPIPDGSAFCNLCGKRQTAAPRKAKHSPNGTGSAYKRGNGYEVQVVVGYRAPGHFDPDNLDPRQLVPVKIRRGGFKSKAAALAAVPEIRAKYNAEPKQNYTLKELFDIWEPWYSPRVDPSTMAGYRAAFNYYSALHGRRIAGISAGDLQECMDACPRGKRTHQNMKVVAGLLWKYAKDKHLVSQVESENLYTGKGRSKKREALTDIEVEKIHKAIGSERYAEYIYALCYLGFRPGEMLELRKDQVIEDKGRLFLIEGKKTDAGRNRTVPVHQKIEDIIRARLWIPGTDLVFPQYTFARPTKEKKNPSFLGFKQMSDNYFREMVFRPIMGRLGLDISKVPYGARHTFSNKLKTAAGADIDKAALIGHSDYTFTQTRYQSTDLEELKAVMDSIK